MFLSLFVTFSVTSARYNLTLDGFPIGSCAHASRVQAIQAVEASNLPPIIAYVVAFGVAAGGFIVDGLFHRCILL